MDNYLKEAVALLLTTGHVTPTISLELPQGMQRYHLTDLSDAQSIPVQAGIVARRGWEESQRHPGSLPHACSFYAEGWKSNNAEELRPVRDQQRREVLVVSLWQRGQPAHTYLVPMIRDHKRRVVDVGETEGPLGTISYQLKAFLQGWADGQRPEADVFGRMDATIRDFLATQSPEMAALLHSVLKEEPELEAFMRKEGYLKEEHEEQ